MMRRWFPGLVALVALFAMSILATPASAGVDIKVHLARQTLTATTPDGTVRQYVISSGKTGFRTIRGTYRPYAMKPYHWSRKYGGAMPNAIFFKGGFAIHGTSAVGRLGTPASHGCVRLAPAAARELYALVKQHGPRSTRISINGVAPDTGKTLYAAKKQNRAVATARANRAAEPRLVVPAFAPLDMVPNNQPFRRLR